MLALRKNHVTQPECKSILVPNTLSRSRAHPFEEFQDLGIALQDHLADVLQVEIGCMEIRLALDFIKLDQKASAFGTTSAMRLTSHSSKACLLAEVM
jgi:hypothetical protein